MDDTFHCVVGKRDLDGSGRSLPIDGQGFDVRFDLGDTRRQGLLQALASLGQSDASRRARKQAHAQTFFKLLHRVAQRRLGCAQLRGGLCEASFLGDGQEHQQFVEVFPWHNLVLP